MALATYDDYLQFLRGDRIVPAKVMLVPTSNGTFLILLCLPIILAEPVEPVIATTTTEVQARCTNELVLEELLLGIRLIRPELFSLQIARQLSVIYHRVDLSHPTRPNLARDSSKVDMHRMLAIPAPQDKRPSPADSGCMAGYLC